jgi:hypothetical protein
MRRGSDAIGVASLSVPWIKAVTKSGRFPSTHWETVSQVGVTTLDALARITEFQPLSRSMSKVTRIAHPVFSAYDFNGVIAEVRISNIARSGDWIAAEYNNQNGSSAFYTMGATSSGP